MSRPLSAPEVAAAPAARPPLQPGVAPDSATALSDRSAGAPGPASSVRDGSEDSDGLPLDERIRRAEQRLVLREEALRARYGMLRQRLTTATRPARFAWPALGVAGGLLSLLLVWRRFGRQARLGRRHPRPPGSDREAGSGRGQDRHPGHAADRPQALSWVRLVAFVWPMLPAPWRAQLSASAAAALATLGAPWFERLMAHRRAAAERHAAGQARQEAAAPGRH